MIESTVSPSGIAVSDGYLKLLYVKKMKARIAAVWDINQMSIEGDTRYRFLMEELTWTPPPTFVKDGVTVTTRVMTVIDGKEVVDEDATWNNILDYITLNAVEIMGYAKDAYYLTKL